jgi:phosphoribosylaminoimidazole carboxylase (NCAIR synthetase)
MKQGTLANYSGKGLENRVEDFLTSYGVVPVMYSAWAKDNIKLSQQTKGILLKNVPYTTIYGGDGRGEFLLSVDNKEDVRIECRQQNVAGSVDEKLPYFFETAVAFEERTVILVVEGDGYKTGAKSWLKSRCEGVLYKKILMLNFEEFKVWALKFFNR